MIALIQRVLSANVHVNDKKIANIESGLLVFLGIEKNDSEVQGKKLLNKVMNYRIFEDQDGKMNNSLLTTKGSLLIVSQFTLAANTTKGLRPGFETAAKPEMAEKLYEEFILVAKNAINDVQSGQFGADMKVSLTNDGPVTFWLQV